MEGVCSQTEALLRQAIQNNLNVFLVINKMDRLIVELKMSPNEAHKRIQRLIEQMNSCISHQLQVKSII